MANKKDLINYFSVCTNLSPEDSRFCVDTVFGGILKYLKRDGSASFSGFGTFKLKPSKVRNVYNLNTGIVEKKNTSPKVGFYITDKGLEDLFSDDKIL